MTKLAARHGSMQDLQGRSTTKPGNKEMQTLIRRAETSVLDPIFISIGQHWSKRTPEVHCRLNQILLTPGDTSLE
jgi:hypothetical protein